jgi:hypothetical protein
MAWAARQRAFLNPLEMAGTSPAMTAEGKFGRLRRARSSTAYSFVHFPFAFEDFTAASINARPLTPSSIVGK